MFSGIVEEVGTVRSLHRQGYTAVLRIGAQKVLHSLAIGDSIAVNGICLTVTDLSSSAVAADATPETLRRTNLGALRAGDPVNLERSLAVGDRIGGHFVQGHVDGVGRVLALRSEGNAVIADLDADADIMRYVVEKGFIAVDGMSLTVIRCDSRGFAISLIPHTRSSSIAGSYRVGQTVNLEVDVLAKYVERLLGERTTGGTLTRDVLAQAGFGE